MNVIQKHIERLGIKRSELARLTGIDAAQVYRHIEKGAVPDAASAKAYCSAFGITMDKFYEEIPLVDPMDRKKQSGEAS